ncbi:SLATT domain-containing protein [Alteromonas gilva]|uniref:SLATT domain-containing protein n=1 Tax=Alteromonas gilva TaxID=2987522 RepID=A0ABT5L0P8_9ALTE|nr:SLATT domain-containing protein [Alteromonas gilva]MDC8829388.1 SLATT domain-containing protein [Alteromonas gilva]
MAEIVDVLKRLQNNSQLTAYAHFGASERMSRLHLWLGIPIALISVGLGSVFVADLQNVVPNFVKWLSGFLSFVAAMLAALQTLFNPKEAKSKHRELANDYLSVSRKSELILANFNSDVLDIERLSESTKSLNDEYDSINKSAQDYPTNNADWRRAKAKITGFKTGYEKSSQ